jgi:tRNA(Ile)-lysidine synthase
MEEFNSRLTKTIRRYAMISPGDRVLAAVSGGPDSMAMLYALDDLKHGMGFTLSCAHMDHGLRPDSGADASFVEAACANLGIACVIYKAELKDKMGPGVNKQAAAREARYAFLESTADRLGAKRIAVAHTMDDQAETYLMRELRGSGSRGLGSIPPVRGRIIRPLIGVTRADVMKYLSRRGVGYRVDPTNLKTGYLRNRLRLELMPALREYNPNIIETLARASGVMRDEDQYLDSAAALALDGMLKAGDDASLSLDTARFIGLHPALKRRAVRLMIERLKGDMLSLGHVHVEDALSLIDAGTTGRGVDLPGGVRMELSYKKALFTLNDEGPPPFREELRVPGSVEIPETGMVVEAERVNEPSPPSGDSVAFEFFDAQRLTGPLVVRSRMSGDTFCPTGMDGTKKLKEFLIDMKMPRRQRAMTPILVAGGDIAWVIGIRADRRFTTRESSAGLIRVTLRKSP